MTTRPGLPLIGRRRELGVLRQSLDEAAQGRPEVVLVSGAAGVGKSSLVSAFVASAFRVLAMRGGGREGQQASPFGVFAESLRPVLHNGSIVAEHLAPLLRTLVSPDDSKQAVSRTRLFEAVLEFLADLDLTGVVVLDDLQWADQSSLELLTFLARNLRTETILIVAVCRDIVPATLRDVLDEIRRTARLTVLQLDDFGIEEVAAALRIARGTDPSAEEVRMLKALTAGNPFFVEQILLSRPRSGMVPAAAKTMLERDVSSMSQLAQHAASLIAVGGGLLPLPILGISLGTTKDELHRALDELTALKTCIMHPESVELRHSLYGEVLIDRLSPVQLRQLHAEIAATGESQVAGLAVLSDAVVAQHWQAAGEMPRAVPALARAARRASAAFAFDEALNLWTEVIGAAEARHPNGIVDHNLLLEAMAGAAAAARWTGNPQESVVLITRALSLTEAADRVQRATFHSRRAYYRRVCGEIDDALWDADRAAKLIRPDDPDALQAAVVSEHARLVVLTGSIDRGLELARQAVDLARAADDPALEGNALNTLGVAHINGGRLDDGIEAMREGQRLSVTYGDFEDTIRAASNLSYATIEGGRIREGLAAATEAIELARRAGVEHFGGAAAVAQDNAIVALVSLGQWKEVERRLDTQLDDGPRDTVHLAWLLGTRAQLYAATGRFDNADRDIHAVEALKLDERWVRAGRVVAAAELALWRHRPDQAFQLTAAELRHGSPLLDRAYLLPWCLRGLADLAETARLRHDGSDAERRAHQAHAIVEEYAPELAGAGFTAATRALLRSEFARACAHSDAQLWASTVQAVDERPYEQAYALFRQADALLASDMPDEPVETLLSHARRLTVELDAKPLGRAIDELAIRHQLALRLPATTATTATTEQRTNVRLTRRELEVLHLILQGMTNRKIGRALGITEKTASVHVSNLLAKLGVANRTAAAAVAHQLGF